MDQGGVPTVTFGGLVAFAELRPTLLYGTGAVAAAVAERCNVVAANGASDSAVEREVSPDGVIVAVGGLTVQAEARALAARRGLPLTIFPTELGRAVLAPGAARVYVDPEQIGGCGHPLAELLASATALVEWRTDQERGRNTAAERYQHWAALSARGLIYAAVDAALALADREPGGVVQLTRLLLLQAQLDAALGHTRATVGAERRVAAALGVPLGAALVWLAEEQGQPTAHLRVALAAAGVAVELAAAQRAAARALVRDQTEPPPDMRVR